MKPDAYRELLAKHEELESRYKDLLAAYDLSYRARLAGYAPPAPKFPSSPRRDYADMLLAPEKTALLVIDMQNEFCSPKGQLYNPLAQVIFPNINKLADFFRRNHLLLIWVRGIENADFSDRGLMEWKYSKGVRHAHTPESWEAQFCKELNGPLPGEIVIEKHTMDVFAGSYIDATLRYFGIESLVFTGVATDGCVSTGARHAHHNNYSPVIVTDGTAARTEERQRVVLTSAEGYWARLLSADEVMKELTALALPSGFQSTYQKRLEDSRRSQP